MSKVSDPVIAYGSVQPLPERRYLRAGPLEVTYQDGFLRNIRLGHVLILHSIYAAVRDQNWGTVPGTIHGLSIQQDDHSFAIHFEMEHRSGDVHFTWVGDINGGTDGTITFSFSGKAQSTFKRNRIGFCVQHPMQLAGKQCEIEHVDGHVTQGEFPMLISPHQPYFDIRAITHEVASGVYARVLMAGDTFEMEDQRNWTDASYKTYCTPLNISFPVIVEAGTTISQTITLSLSGNVPDQTMSREEFVTITAGKSPLPVPPIGLGWSDVQLTDTALHRLVALRPSHLRVDLRLYQPDWREVLHRATLHAKAMGTGLEMAVFVSDDAATGLQALNEAKPESVVRLLIFHKDEKSTSARWVKLAREYLTTDAPIGAGTDAFFTEINRERPPVEDIDFACYSLNPQVHAFDNDSLVETLPVQGETVISTKAFIAGKPVVVSPVTLKMRWNPNATASQPEIPRDELPPQVDTRQMSLFGAGWTLGSIKYLIEGGADSLTYYETAGWLGVMDHENPLSDQFPAIAGSVYPLYHVLADILEFADGSFIKIDTSQPLSISALALQGKDRYRLLIANHTSESLSVVLDGNYAMRLLDTETATSALTQPETYRKIQIPAESPLRLPPYAYVCLDRRET